MKKTLLSSLLLSTILSADTFEQFLSHALEHSHSLQASKLDIAISKEESEKLLPYKNPTVGVDYARFDPDHASADDGYSVNIAQPLRLWGIFHECIQLDTYLSSFIMITSRGFGKV